MLDLPFGRNTRIREPFFRMRLPGRWQRYLDPERERWTFSTEREQIIVSVIGSATPLALEAQRKTLQQLILIRRQSELEVAPGAHLLETVFGGAGDQMFARYEGSGPDPQRLFSCLILTNPTLIGTFYYEAAGLTPDEFHDRGRAAFNSLQLARSTGV